MNINKYIASSGMSSRRGADEVIKAGKVKINNQIAKPTDKVLPGDLVSVDGQIVKPLTEKIYLAFNKPFGVISTTDENSNNNIMQYIDISERVFPVGRLDVRSEGLILLTNDGELAQEVLKNKIVEKEYLVEVNKNLTDSFLDKLTCGVRIDGWPTLPAKIKKITNKSFRITITEGRKRQIRRMCEKFHYEVSKLQRIRIGKIELRDIEEGEYIKIDPQKIRELLGLSSTR